MSAPIRVLIVDDSVVTRQGLRRLLEGDPEIVVVGGARSGEEGVELATRLAPDVVTMDLEMPGIGGLEALRRIVAQNGPPVIVVSSASQSGAQATLDALDAGAIDFVAKPGSGLDRGLKLLAQELVAKVRAVGHRELVRPAAIADAASPRAAAAFGCVAIATSTGGPAALSRILPRLPQAFPVPIVVVQHMPAGFTGALAQRLHAACAIAVIEAEDGMPLRAGTAAIAPGGRHMRVRRAPGGAALSIVAPDPGAIYIPSADATFESVALSFDRPSLGIILTGMGNDGVRGLRTLREHGGYVLGQDEASSVVYGMPRAAAQAGLVDRVVTLEAVAEEICALAGVAPR